MAGRRVPDYAGIFTFDPGGTTGVAWSMLKIRDTVKETLLAAEVHSQDVTGTYQEQARKLRDLWHAVRFEWTVERSLSAGDVYVVSEGFSISKIGTRAKVGLYPIWVAAMFEGLVDDVDEVEYQEPSCKTFATSDRLKRWGLWERGASEHRKDAKRHLAYKLGKILG